MFIRDDFADKNFGQYLEYVLLVHNPDTTTQGLVAVVIVRGRGGEDARTVLMRNSI